MCAIVGVLIKLIYKTHGGTIKIVNGLYLNTITLRMKLYNICLISKADRPQDRLIKNLKLSCDSYTNRMSQ